MTEFTLSSRRLASRCGLCLSLALTAATAPLLLLPNVAHAEPSASEVKLAGERLKQGKAAYKRKRYEPARKALWDAQRLAPSHESALYLGLASGQTKHYGDAARMLRQYLNATDGQSSAERDEALKMLETVMPQLGTLEIVAPRDTELFLDDESEKFATAPTQPLLLEPGKHTIRGRAPDGSNLMEDVTVSKGETHTLKLGEPEPVAAVGPSEEVDPEPAPRARKSGRSVFAPPKTMAPVVISLGVAAVGAAGALVFGLSRNNAQAASDSVDAQIRAETRGPGGGVAGTCASSDPAITAYYGSACATLKSNRDAVDRNALLTNISFGVIGAGALAAVGFYLFLPKAEKAPAADEGARGAKLRIDQVSPMRLGLDGHGVGVSGSF